MCEQLPSINEALAQVFTFTDLNTGFKWFDLIVARFKYDY